MAISIGNGSNGIFATINITPLTDIFLVLLIIFMVATAVTIGGEIVCLFSALFS